MAWTKQMMQPMTQDEKNIAKAKLEEIEKKKQLTSKKEKLQDSTGGKSKMKARFQLMWQQKLFMEIRNAQAALDLAIPRAPLMKVIRDIALRVKGQFRWQTRAIICLHEALEDFLIYYLNHINTCVTHAKRVTLMDKDMVVVSRVRYRFDTILKPLAMRDIKALKILTSSPALKRKRST